MPNQGVNFTILDQGLGLSPAGSGSAIVVCGVSSAGTANQPFFSSQAQPFVTTFGYGPGPELAAYLANATGNVVGFVKAATSGAGTNTAVTTTRAAAPTGFSTSTSVVTITGTPNDTYYAGVKVIAPAAASGTIGTAGIQFQVSLDNFRTIYQTVNLGTATTYVIPNTGLTVNFAAGTLNPSDLFTWISFEPTWSDATVTSALQTLIGVNVPTYEDILVAGAAASSNASNFDTNATFLFNQKRFTRILGQARDATWGGTSTETEVAWMTSIEADYAVFQSSRVGITGGHYNFISPISSVQYRRPLLWGAGARDSAVSLEVDLGEVDLGSIPMVLPSTPDGFIYHDESVISGLDSSRFMSMWSLQGLPGLYVKNPNLMAQPGSDFKWLQYGHVVDAACVVAYQFFVLQLSKKVRVNAATGSILAQDANKLQAACNAKLSAALLGKVSPAIGTTPNPSTIVDQTNNILSTQQLNVTISIVPLAYPKVISVTITFLNPALVQTAVSVGGTIP
jgi:hypothetical protein